MPVLYLTEQGSTLRKEGRRFVVDKDNETLLEIPESRVERVLVFGNVQITTQAIVFLLHEGIETAFFSTAGKYRGRLSPAKQPAVHRRLTTALLHEAQQFETDLGRAIVRAKILNSISVLERHYSDYPDYRDDRGLDALRRNIDNLDSIDDIAGLMAAEGRAARVYFILYGSLFRGTAKFDKRSRRPAADPVNACLNLAYTLLTSEMTGVLYAAGFDPYVGIFHAVRAGRPGLALDMVEEFRHLADRLVLRLFNRRQLKPDENFETSGQRGVRLSRPALKTFFRAYEKLMNSPVRAEDGTNFHPRRRMSEQAEALARTVLNRAPYQPFLWKE